MQNSIWSDGYIIRWLYNQMVI